MKPRVPASYTAAADACVAARNEWMRLATSWSHLSSPEDPFAITRAREKYEELLRRARWEEDKIEPKRYLKPNVRREELSWDEYFYGPIVQSGRGAVA